MFKHLRLHEHISSALPSSSGSLERAHTNDRFSLKLKLQCVGHLMWRANSLEKTLTLGKIEGKRRRGWQSVRGLDGTTDSMNINLNKFWEIVKDREAWCAAAHGVTGSRTRLSDWTTTVLSLRALHEWDSCAEGPDIQGCAMLLWVFKVSIFNEYLVNWVKALAYGQASQGGWSLALCTSPAWPTHASPTVHSQECAFHLLLRSEQLHLLAY